MPSYMITLCVYNGSSLGTIFSRFCNIFHSCSALIAIGDDDTWRIGMAIGGGYVMLYSLP